MIVEELTKLVIEIDAEESKTLKAISEKTGETQKQALQRAVKNFLSQGVRTETKTGTI